MGIFNAIAGANKKVDPEDVVIVKDFTRRAPFWDYRTVDYKISDRFMSFQNEIDIFMSGLYPAIDEANGDVLDNLIIDVTKIEKELLEKQRIIHQDTIRSFLIRYSSDELVFKNELDILKEELEANRIILEKVEKLINKSEFIEDTKEELL